MSAKLHSVVIPDGRLQAFSPPIMGADAFRGGPVLDGVDGIDRLSQHSYQQRIYRVRENEQYVERIHGTVAYAGPLINHFGHFVSSSIHRILPSRLLYDCNRYAFLTSLGDRHVSDFSKIPSYLAQILSFLELDGNNCLILNRNAIVENLVVVEPGASIGCASNDQYLDMLRDFSFRRLAELHCEPIRSRKILVAGRKGPGGNILGSSYVESVLERAGFWVFRPEEYPYSFQLHVYNQANVLVFIEGSAIHGASLLGRDMLDNVFILARRPSASGNFYSELVGRCKNINTAYCSTFLGTLIFDKFTHVAANHFGISLYNTESLKQFFISLGAHSFFGFDTNKYFEECEKELIEYISWSLSEVKSPCSASQINDICSRFELAKRSTIN